VLSATGKRTLEHGRARRSACLPPLTCGRAGVEASDAASSPKWLLDTKVQQPGLKSTPIGSGVQNATSRFLLPDPTLAVRNLVRGKG